jgi:transposase-like protein
MKSSEVAGNKFNRRRGRPAFGKKPEKEVLIRLYESEGRSVRDIAEILSCSKDMIFRSLREYQIKARTNARRSSLRQHDLKYLEEGVKQKGLRGFASELRVDNSTLLHHRRIRKGMK